MTTDPLRMSARDFRKMQGLPIANENSPRPQLRAAQSAQQAATLYSNGEGEAQGAGQPHVCFVLCRVHLFDVDGKYGAIKDLLDGLQYAGLICGDREDQITLEVRQQKVAHFAEQRTEITIEYP